MGVQAPGLFLAKQRPVLSPGLPIALFSSVSGNDSCGVDTDTKYNDTDLCWGPLRRVDAYRIYLVSVLSRPGAYQASVHDRECLSPFSSLSQPFLQRGVLHTVSL